MEEDLPIDIHTGKLVDWLLSRRHVKKNWPEAVQLIREKINNAIQDMPEHPDITRLLSGSYINYFHCLQIIEILRETEKESKNIFGWYSSQRMKDWQEVVRLYESDNVYLVEASQFLVRNVSYEIPSLKKQINKCQQFQKDFVRKVGENQKSSVAAKDKYFSACKKIGIVGENPHEELLGLLNKLPETFRSIGEKVKGLQEARQYYEDYLHFIISPTRSCLKLLAFIIDHGDVTVYQWKYGEPPLNIERESIDFLSNQNGEGIDFGPVDGSRLDEIDFGDDVQLETGDIDWGNLDCQDNSDQIDYGDVAVLEEVEAADIVVESSGMEGGVATGIEALTLLHNEPTRTQFINELLELEGFLSQRAVELEADENILSMSLFSDAPRSLQYQNTEKIIKYLHDLSEITKELASTKMQHLYMISSSPRYVDRLVDSLKSHLRDGDRMRATIDTMKQKREDSVDEEAKLSQHLGLIVSRTKELQKNIEHSISLKYNNRTVNLMGGIQQLL